MAAVVRGIDLQPSAHEPRGFLEPVMAGDEVAGHPVDLAVGRIDVEHPPHLDLEIVAPVFDPGHGRRQRPRLEAPLVDGEGARERLGARFMVAVVETAPGQEEVRVQVVRIDLDGSAGRRFRRRGVRVGQGAGHPQQRRRPVFVDLQRRLVRLRGIRLVVLLAEEVAPEGVDGGVVGGDARRAPQQRVGLPIAPQGPRGAGRPVQVDGVRRALQPVDEHPQAGRRVVAQARAFGARVFEQTRGVAMQQRQLEPRRADRVLGRHRRQPPLGRLVLAAQDVEPRQQRRRRRVAGIPLAGQGPRFVAVAVRQRPGGRAVELLFLGPRVPGLGRRRRRPQARDAEDGRAAEPAEAGTSARHCMPSPLHQATDRPIISGSRDRRGRAAQRKAIDCCEGMSKRRRQRTQDSTSSTRTM